jgi:RecA/RadA recombinase/intein/homing endonuclease
MSRLIAEIEEEEVIKGNYFSSANTSLELIPSGCCLLDCSIGGGWAIGRIVNIVGDKSTGKCANDFYFLTKEGLMYSDDCIKHFPDGLSDWKAKLAYDAKELVETSHFWKETVENTIKITTSHGFELNATPDHKIMILNPNLNFEMKRLEDLQENDQVVLICGLNLFPEDYVNLTFKFKTKVRTFEPITKIPKYLTPELGSLLGFFVADGTISSGSLVITTQKEWAQNSIVDSLQKVFGCSPKVKWDLIDFSCQIKEILPYLFGKNTLDGVTARYKYVPPFILQSPKDVQKQFLKSLLSCDSEITKKGLIYTTASRQLAREVHMMLLNFGVVATFSNHWVKLKEWDDARIYFDLSLHGIRFDKFLDKIGTFRTIGRNKSKTPQGGGFLSIPYVGDRLRDEIISVRKKLGWSKNGKLADGGRFPKTGLFSLQKYSGMSRDNLLDNLFILQGIISDDFINTCLDISEDRFIFDKIVKKEEINQEQIVCDVHVPEKHLFWSSGFISHNTLCAIEASANFALRYPKGKIFYREAEAAFDLPYAEALGMPIDKVDFGDRGSFVTVEDFEEDLNSKLDELSKQRIPGLYIVDSLDALSDRDELTRDIDKGTYGANKAKRMSGLFRKLTQKVEQSRMCIMIISQIRDNIGVTFGSKTSRSGGHALDFYSSQVVYLSHIKTLRREIRGVERAYGIKIRSRCTKNKVGLPFREAEFEIHFGYGIDSLGANVEWLLEVNRLDILGITAKPTPVKEYRSAAKLYLKRVDSIENPQVYNGTVKEVEDKVRQVWSEIEESFLPVRKKYI